MQFHPRNENILLVVPMKHAPVVVNVATGTHRQEEKQDAFEGTILFRVTILVGENLPFT